MVFTTPAIGALRRRFPDATITYLVEAPAEPVVRHHPAIGRIRQSLLDAGAAFAAMSGSGSAVFGLFERADAARRTANDLARPGWLSLHTRTVNRRDYDRRVAAGL